MIHVPGTEELEREKVDSNHFARVFSKSDDPLSAAVSHTAYLFNANKTAEWQHRRDLACILNLFLDPTKTPAAIALEVKEMLDATYQE